MADTKIDTLPSGKKIVSPNVSGGGGGTPDPHASTHENAGSDEIDVGGLSGELADAQKVEVRKEGTSIGTRGAINLHDGLGVAFTVTDDSGSGEVDITADVSLPGIPATPDGQYHPDVVPATTYWSEEWPNDTPDQSWSSQNIGTATVQIAMDGEQISSFDNNSQTRARMCGAALPGSGDLSVAWKLSVGSANFFSLTTDTQWLALLITEGTVATPTQIATCLEYFSSPWINGFTGYKATYATTSWTGGISDSFSSLSGARGYDLYILAHWDDSAAAGYQLRFYTSRDGKNWSDRRGNSLGSNPLGVAGRPLYAGYGACRQAQTRCDWVRVWDFLTFEVGGRPS